jgi:uncharacterized protein
MANLTSINHFLAQKHIAVAGVSRTKKKFGNYLCKALIDKGYEVFPIHPALATYEGRTCYASISDLPDEVSAIVINTKPENTKKLAEESFKKGIRHIWLQQGSTDKETISHLNGQTENIITGKCLMMFLEPVKGIHGVHRWLSKAFGNYPN